MLIAAMIPPEVSDIFSLSSPVSSSDSGARWLTLKAQYSSNSLLFVIDGPRRRRYSQAQIPDLVANAIPRFRQAAQSSGSDSPSGAQNPFKMQYFFQSFPAGVCADASGSKPASNLLALEAEGRCSNVSQTMEATRNL